MHSTGPFPCPLGRWLYCAGPFAVLLHMSRAGISPVCRTHATALPMEISKKTRAPSTHRLRRTKFPPHHREMVTRLASEIEKASNPHYPIKLYKYATQALTEALKSKRRATPPPP